jgi:hypothetical protein
MIIYPSTDECDLIYSMDLIKNNDIILEAEMKGK